MTIPVKAQIIQKFEEYDSIILHRHVNPDPDALGSQIGLKIILSELFEKNVYVVGEEVSGLQFMGQMDEVPDELFESSLCIVLDTANEARISDQRFQKSPFVIKIDHHPDREPFGDISWVDTSFSSTSEMIVDLFRFSGGLEIPEAAAKSLFTGFIGDTGRFLYSNTNQRTMNFATLLRSYSFDPQEIYTNLYTISPNTARAKGVLFTNMVVNDSGFAYSVFSKKEMDSLGIDASEAANLVNEMSYIEGVKVWLIFVEDQGKYRVRLRSAGIPIDKLANKYNGGGHPQASGASISLEQLDGFIQATSEYLQTQKDL